MSLSKLTTINKVLAASQQFAFNRATGELCKPSDKDAVQLFTSVQKFHMFLAIAQWPGSTQGDLLVKTGQNRGNGGKNIMDLTTLTSARAPGPGLVSSEIDPRDRKYRVIDLTDKGKAVYDKLKEVM